MSCIKSIQRGSGSGNATITINPVDINKSVVLISGGNTYWFDGKIRISGLNPIAVLSSNTNIAVSNAVFSEYDGYGTVSLTRNVPYAWQVIEFA